MTPLLTRLCALVCDGHPAIFRYTPPERRFSRQAAWDLIYTDEGGVALSVGCSGCDSTPPDGEPNPEILARAELDYLARKMRRDAKRVQAQRAEAEAEIGRLIDYAARCDAEAAELEARASDLEQP